MADFKEIERRTIDHSTLIKFEEHLGEDNILASKDIIERMAVANQPPNSKGRHSYEKQGLSSQRGCWG